MAESVKLAHCHKRQSVHIVSRWAWLDYLFFIPFQKWHSAGLGSSPRTQTGLPHSCTALEEGAETASPAASCECVSALSLLLHLHRLELKSSERRRQFEEAADGSRTELVWRNREKSDDGRKQDRTEPPGWSWIPRQTGPEVSESSSREGESEKPFTLAQFILRTVQTRVSRPWGISRVEVPAQTLLMSAVKQQSSCWSWTLLHMWGPGVFFSATM